MILDFDEVLIFEFT